MDNVVGVREGNLRVLDAAQLIVLSQILPANGRDVLVRLGAAPPEVDEAHEAWSRLDQLEIVRLRDVTGKRDAVHVLAGLRLYWQAAVAEADRRRSKVGDWFTLL
jgi:hypothetical protein